MNTLARILATWFGCGYWPWGPGTIGSAAAVLIAIASGCPAWTFAIAALILLPIGIWASDVEARSSGRKDPGHVVIDEVAGQWITLAMGGSAAGLLTWKAALIAFGLFRVFDIVKPPPARQFEKFPGGTGIMMDDVMAGVYGAVVMALMRWLNFY